MTTRTRPTESSKEMERRRERMVEHQIQGRGIRDPAVLLAMRTVPREEFVPENLRDYAYEDGPLPIGHEQTISQPYIVAWMAEMLSLEPGSRVLEIGAGSGYMAAILSRIAAEVVTVERHAALAGEAAARLKELGYDNVRVFVDETKAVTPLTTEHVRGVPDTYPFGV